MALSLVDSFDDLELDNLDADLELLDLEHDDLDFLSFLCILSPSFNQLRPLYLNENAFSSISVNHNSSV